MLPSRFQTQTLALPARVGLGAAATATSRHACAIASGAVIASVNADAFANATAAENGAPFEGSEMCDVSPHGCGPRGRSDDATRASWTHRSDQTLHATACPLRWQCGQGTQTAWWTLLMWLSWC